jgi:cell division protein FtsQ
MISSTKKNRRFNKRPARKKGLNWNKASKVILATIMLLALTGGIAGTVYGIKKWMSTCSYFYVSSVEVHGEKRLTKKEILDLSGIRIGDNIFSLDLKDIARKLSSQPWIRFARVERRLPDALVIHVEERQPVALARIGERLFLVDRDGTPFKYLQEQKGFSAPVITGIDKKGTPSDSGDAKPAVNRSKMDDALKIIKMSRKGVRALGYNNISQIDFPDDQTVVIYTADRAVPFYLNRDGLKKQFYRAEKILFQLYNSGQYPKVVSVNVGYGKDMALAKLKKK